MTAEQPDETAQNSFRTVSTYPRAQRRNHKPGAAGPCLDQSPKEPQSPSSGTVSYTHLLGVVIQVLTLLHAVRTPGAPLGVTLVRLLRIIAGNIFVNSMIGSGGAYMRIPLLLVAAIGGLAIMVWGWRSAPLAPVSYTHLDVYKRQATKCST